MNHFSGAFLLSFILIAGCTANEKDSPLPQTHTASFVDSKEKEIATVSIIEPVVEPLLVLPIYSRGGGGGGGRYDRLSCESGTSDCNDHNPCTIDSCENDTCTHKLDESKDQFGSCETDGRSCTVGKCIEYAGKIQCFEQRREYISGELGCQDNNQCTTDSCIEIPFKKEPKVTKEGDVIPNNEHQCVYEISSGLLCQAAGCFSGFCEQTGTGMNPEDPFMVGCVVPEEAVPSCPTTGNPCTTNICVEGGCVEENVPAETPCDDDNICTENDTCNGEGFCLGTDVDLEIVCGASPEQCRAFACNNSLGCVLTAHANEGQACRTGDPCIENETCSEGVCGNGSEVICPSNGNPCMLPTCQSGLGCIYEPITEDPKDPPACSDNNNCTTNDACVNGQCLGEDLDCATDADNPCQLGFCDASNEEDSCTTINFTGLYGADCITNYPGICAAGAFMCSGGLLTDMCMPLIRPGDVPAPVLCNDINNYKDNNCDGEVDNPCNCAVPPETTTRRYVDPDGDNNNPSSNDCTNDLFPCQTISHAISVALSGDTLVLSDGVFTESNLIIGKDLFIFGQGQDLTTVDANNSNRVFWVNAGVEAAFCGLTITGGSALDGSGIYNRGILSVSSSTITGNSAEAGGGMFNNNGAVTITQSTISNNTASVYGGGLYNDGTNAVMNIIESAISDNMAGGSGGGMLNNGTATITQSTISNNTANGDGGGLYNDGNNAVLNIIESTINNNTAGNSSGGIANAFGTATITQSTINGNMATSFAGAVLNYSSPSTMHIVNSTISGNSSPGVGGVRNFNTIFVSNSTITRNSGTSVGGLQNGNNATATVDHSIIADQISGADCLGIITGNYNLSKNSACGAGFTQEGSFSLPGLANNGGPTQTHALIPGGAGAEAIDAGDTTCGVTTDQRGEKRPVNYTALPEARCDIGAFEVQP
jgi:hypothetical protein